MPKDINTRRIITSEVRISQTETKAFIKEVNREVNSLKKLGFTDFSIDQSYETDYQEDGSYIALIATRPETDEEFNVRTEKSRVRSEKTKAGWAKRRARLKEEAKDIYKGVIN